MIISASRSGSGSGHLTGVVSSWLALLLSVVANIASGNLPAWLEPFAAWAWLALLPVMLVANGFDVVSRIAARRRASSLSALLGNDGQLAHSYNVHWSEAVHQAQDFVTKQLRESIGNTPPVRLELALVDGSPESRPMTIVELFDGASSVLLLGAPGAGKTGLLLDLASTLIARVRIAEERGIEDRHPIPVLLSLADWGRTRRRGRKAGEDAEEPLKDLGQWLVGQMRRQLGIRPAVARAWFSQHRVALLLDGLDELPHSIRRRCARIIADLIKNENCPKIVLTSRHDDYYALGVEFKVATTASIIRLSRYELSRYLESGDPRLRGLRAAFQRDPSLWQLVDTPLWLHVAQRVFSQETVGGGVLSGSLSRRRRQLLHWYITDIVRRRMDVNRFDPGRTMRWLVQAAQLVRDDDFPTTVDLRHLTRRAKLPPRAAQAFYSWVVAPMSAALVVTGLIAPLTTEVGLVAGALASLASMLLLGIVIADQQPAQYGTDPTQGRRGRRWLGWLVGISVGLAIGWLLNRVGATVVELLTHLPPVWTWLQVVLAIAVLGLILVLALPRRLKPAVFIASVCSAVVIPFWSSAFAGFSEGVAYGVVTLTAVVIFVPFDDGPGRKWGRGATPHFMGYLGVASLGLIVAAVVTDRAVVGPWLGPIIGLPAVVMLVLVIRGIVIAAFGSRLELLGKRTTVRAVLCWTGLQPVRIVSFLSEVAKNGLVIQVDGAWRFRHAVFMEHLADCDPLDAAGPEFWDGMTRDDGERDRLVAVISRELSNHLSGIAEPPRKYLTPTPKLVMDSATPWEGALRGATSFVDLFDRSEQSLLLVGDSNEQRSTLLRVLAADLAGRISRDREQPIPLLLDLAGWRPNWPYRPRPPLGPAREVSRWLCHQLGRTYQFEPGTVLRWLSERELVLLVDGLDRMPGGTRARVMGALNEFLDGARPTPMVVTDDATKYKGNSFRLALNVAVGLRDLAAMLPVGNRSTMLLLPGAETRNDGTTVNKLSFSGRAVDRMQQRGLVPSVVAHAIRHGRRSKGLLDLPICLDSDNGILVLLDKRRKTVLTVTSMVRDGSASNAALERMAAAITAYESGTLSLHALVERLEVCIHDLTTDLPRAELYAQWWIIEQAHAIALANELRTSSVGLPVESNTGYALRDELSRAAINLAAAKALREMRATLTRALSQTAVPNTMSPNTDGPI